METVLCGDIGGTNANFCLADISQGVEIIKSAREVTQGYTDFVSLLNYIFDVLGHEPEVACFAVAGIVKDQRVEMTNANIVIDSEEIKRKTSIKHLLIINDFEAIGYAINILGPEDAITLNCNTPKSNALRVILGAGTGLGQNILVYSQKYKIYIPYPSEGGHVDFPFIGEEEMALRDSLDIQGNIIYEDLLSGRGLERIYRFLQTTRYPNEPTNRTAKEISHLRHNNSCCQETFANFIKFYARCARNFALETLPFGGLTIAGGIAAANQDMFDEKFTSEFLNHSNKKIREVLQKIPINLITNYEISLKGAAYALKYF